jgi:hypothetical protein
VFTDEAGGPVYPRAVLRAVQRSAGRVGIDGVTVHTLRHSAAAAWLKAGVHIKAVADLLGHSSIAITGDLLWARLGRGDPLGGRRAVRGARSVVFAGWGVPKAGLGTAFGYGQVFGAAGRITAWCLPQVDGRSDRLVDGG